MRALDWVLTLTLWTCSTHASFPKRNLASLLMLSIDIFQILVLNQMSSPNFSWSFLFLSDAQHNSHFAWSFHSSSEILSIYWSLWAYGSSKMLLLWNLCPICLLLGPPSAWPPLDYERILRAEGIWELIRNKRKWSQRGNIKRFPFWTNPVWLSCQRGVW